MISHKPLTFILCLFCIGICHGNPVNTSAGVSRNLLVNPAFAGSGSWSLSSGTTYVAATSNDTGTGSIRFSVDDPAAKSAWYAQIQSSRIRDFKYSTPYTITALVRSDFTPTYLDAYLQTWDRNGKKIPYASVTTTTGMASMSATGGWQEVRFMVSVHGSEVKEIAVCIGRSMNDWGLKRFYIDSVYFGEGVLSTRPDANRRGFQGSRVRIDEHGNWSVLEKNEWKPFFPFGLYPYLSRKDYLSLSRQGFNLVLSQQYQSQIAIARNAVSSFNPNGMKAGLRLSKYATPGDKLWTLPRLTSEIQSILTTQHNGVDLSDTLIMYDWDNENSWKTWQHWFQMVNTIRSSDSDRPIYILNGYPGVQPLFDNLSDVSGTYVSLGFQGSHESGFAKYEVLNTASGQQTPASIAQLNDMENRPYGLREMTYNALIKGAKGVVIWGDGVPAKDKKQLEFMESRAWWMDVPNLRREIDRLLPVLRVPSSTSVALSSDDSGIHFDLREFANQLVLLVLNPGSADKSVTFTSPTYRIRTIAEYFSGSAIASPENNVFKIQIPAHSTAVYTLSAIRISQSGQLPAPMPPTINPAN